MSNIAQKTSSNVLYQARCEASTHKEALTNRESAAEIMSIDRGRLYRIESGITDPYPEEICKMADLYGMPELKNWYCREKCPLGDAFPMISDASLDRITIREMSAFERVNDMKDMLLAIVADGMISADEQEDLYKIVTAVDELNEANQNLKNWMEKNLKQEGYT
jgi:transcriptional regulator with XRE-family HTH domain